jgi:hypothetical protein
MKKLFFFTTLIFTIFLVACSSGDGSVDGDNSKPSVNDTSWDSLVWDDGTDEKTRKWAD